MGFHPQSGEELKPVNKQTVDEWRKQSSKIVKRMPTRIADPDKFGFFDPLTGSPKVWFWVSEAGEYEFFDGPGFQPRSGDALKVATRDEITDKQFRLLMIALRKNRSAKHRRPEINLRRDKLPSKPRTLQTDRLRMNCKNCNRRVLTATGSEQIPQTKAERLMGSPSTFSECKRMPRLMRARTPSSSFQTS